MIKFILFFLFLNLIFGFVIMKAKDMEKESLIVAVKAIFAVSTLALLSSLVIYLFVLLF